MTKWYLLVDRFANTIVSGKERWLSDTCWLTGVPTSTQRSSYRCSQSTDGISQVYVVVWAWSSNAVTTCELCHCYFFSLSWRAYILLWLSVNMMDFHPITCVWYLLTPVVYESLVKLSRCFRNTSLTDGHILASEQVGVFDIKRHAVW